MTQTIFRFTPFYQKRVWGGRALETRLGRDLPDGEPYGESWEISTRKEADSVVREGACAGKRLSQLWGDLDTRAHLFGPEAPAEKCFPLLCKILDARDKLSIQVHPPVSLAAQLGGEPKTEVWYVAWADPGAALYAGIKRGVSVDQFQDAIREGRAEEVIHVLHPKKGDFILIESGRLHAIGAGLLLYEIQQNSDTTYRVYDWHRPGLDGQPRQLHLSESMRCINFDDVEPSLGIRRGSLLCECDYFRLEEHQIKTTNCLEKAIRGRFAIITVVEGTLQINDVEARVGDFFMVRFGADWGRIETGLGAAKILLTTWP